METFHEECEFCEGHYIPDPEPELLSPEWIERERSRGLAYIHSVFRPLRLKYGLATSGDIIYQVYEDRIKEQLENDTKVLKFISAYGA